MNNSMLLGLAALLLSVANAAAADAQDVAGQVFETSGVRGGVVVLLGCGDGKLASALRSNASFQVQALDRDPAKVAAARETLLKLGVYGDISAARLEGGELPYIDNLVNLVVAPDPDLLGVSLDEILRVLTPGGAACVKQDGAWRKIAKPRPAELDDWTHYFYDARGNAVSKDTVVAPPERLQWVGTPRWSRHHDRMSSLSAMVSGGGRIFYIMDEGSRVSILLPSKWMLTARDAFNGTVLWKKPIERWQSQMWPLKSGPTQLARRLVAESESRPGETPAVQRTGETPAVQRATPMPPRQRIYVTLALGAPISCLDGATGEVLRVYEESKGTEEILLAGGVLYALVNPRDWALTDFAPKFNTGDQKRVETEFNWDQKPRELLAIEAATGRLLWKEASAKVAPLTLATDGQRLVYYDGEKVVCRDCASGKQAWASAPEGKRKLFEYNYGPRIVLHDKVILYAGGDGAMKGLDAATGKELWTAPHQKSGYRSPEDLLVAGGLVWSAPTTSGNMSGAFTGRNPLTGEVKVEFPPDIETYWFHHRCYIAKATERFIIPSRTGIEFVDIKAKHWDINHWVRGACLYGTLPCNGLVYAGPHNCACYPEAKLDGMNALAGGAAGKLPPLPPDEQRLERGPAYGARIDSPDADAKDWPTYRHDAARSGFTDQPLLADMGKAWEVNLGGRLSPPVVAAGKVFVSQVDRHTVHALDSASGKSLWHFTAGGRVDSPPTYWKGRVLFGCMDGSVYCLRAEDGALVWRFRAAPSDRRHGAFEQLESVWPVHGSVLVENGVASCVAGRSVFLDGGLRFLRLDAATGKKIVETVYDDKDPETGKDLQTRVRTLQMPVGLNDILSSDGKFTYLRSQKIDADGKRIDLGPVSGNAIEQGAAQKGEGAHVIAPTGFLDDSWFHRSYWVFGKHFAGGHNGYFQAGKYAPGGRILVFDEKNVYAFGREPQYYKWTTVLEHQLFSASREAPNAPAAAGPGVLGRAAKRKAGKAGAPAAGANANPTSPAVRFPDSEKLDPGNKALTVEAWINPDTKDAVIVSQGGGLNGFALELQDGRPAFSIRANKEGATAASKDALVGNAWHHVAGVLGEDKKLRVYVDGKLAGESRGPGLIPRKPNLPLQLGAAQNSLVSDYGHGEPYTGMLDQFALYHRALSGDEIAEHARGNLERAGAGPVVACSFDKGDARDESGNKIDGVSFGIQTGKGKSGAALWFNKPEAGKGAPPAAAAAANKGSFVQQHWTRPVPVMARAMAMAGKTVLLAGPPDLVDETYAFERLTQKDPAILENLAAQDAALNDKKGATLLAVSAGDGGLNKDFELESSPVWDGMVVAQGRIFVSAVNGKLVCFGKP